MKQKRYKGIEIDIEANISTTDETNEALNLRTYTDFLLLPTIKSLDLEVSLYSSHVRAKQRSYETTVEVSHADSGTIIASENQNVSIGGGRRWGTAKISVPLFFDSLKNGQRITIRAYIEGQTEYAVERTIRLLCPNVDDMPISNWCAIESAGWHLERRKTLYRNPDLTIAEYQIVQFNIQGDLPELWGGEPPEMQLKIINDGVIMIRNVWPKLVIRKGESSDGLSHWVVEGGFWLIEEEMGPVYAELCCMGTPIGGFVCDVSCPPVKGAVEQPNLSLIPDFNTVKGSEYYQRFIMGRLESV